MTQSSKAAASFVMDFHVCVDLCVVCEGSFLALSVAKHLAPDACIHEDGIGNLVDQEW